MRYSELSQSRLPTALVNENFLPVAAMTSSAAAILPLLRRPATPSATSQNVARNVPTFLPEDLEARAFESLVAAKVLTSQVAMHLSDLYRKRLFSNLDQLHDVAEWEVGDSPMLPASFRTFLRTMFILSPSRWPSLGLTHDGYLFGIWGTAGDRVTLEFLENDRFKWVLSYPDRDGETVRNAGIGSSQDVAKFLSPYDPKRWFDEIR